MSDPQKIKERPIDPTRNAEDIIGDTTGLTGITTSSPQQGGADPEEAVPDSSHLPGTLINEPNAHPTYGVPEDAVSTDTYTKNTKKGMSDEQRKRSDDYAEENETHYDKTLDLDDTTRDENVNQTYSVPPSVIGETSVSGDMPNVDADDDMLSNAQAVGTQMSEDEEHPQDIDIARDVDKAEEKILES